ncbi:hypothetical protein Q3G72_000915 [Acer saccharum]|nr:hypothetical protein Q3G72_000915 [Acer saccharum]
MDELALQEGAVNEEDESSTCGSTVGTVSVDYTSTFTTDMIFNSRKEYPQVLDYVKQTWLVKYKEKFVAAWTDLTMHFGNVTMNRDETMHVKLKRHFGQQCLTFLPLRSVPLPCTSRKVIAIGFVNESHFVEVFMYPDESIIPLGAFGFKPRFLEDE